MSNNIKSFDLCSKCEFRCFNNGVRTRSCSDCERMDGVGCECARIPPNTPCPFYTPAENE